MSGLRTGLASEPQTGQRQRCSRAVCRRHRKTGISGSLALGHSSVTCGSHGSQDRD